MFGFEILESLAESKRILEGSASASFASWRSVANGYRSAKSPLIAALDSATGRRTYPYVHEVSAADSAAAWRYALRGTALDAARTAEYAQRIRHAHADLEHAESAQQSVVRAARTVELLASAHEALRRFSQIPYPEDGVVPSGEALAPWQQLCQGIRAGQRIGRALAAYLRQEGQTADDASRIVDTVTQAAQVAPRSGEIVLSANPLDILFCSECCGYSSCHSLDGCYRAGPQQYLADTHTIVVYYWETERTWKNLSLPYKLFRQIVYADAKRQCAALQRHYGQALPRTAHEAIRRGVAQLLARLFGQPDGDIHWYHSTDPKNAVVEYEGEHLAYLDGTIDYVTLARGKRPQISLPDAPCGACGSSLDNAGMLTCSECADDTNHCCVCGQYVRELDCHHSDNGDCYCNDCYEESYTSCIHCEREVCYEDTTVVGESRVCECCLNRHYFHCQHCDSYANDDNNCGHLVEEESWCANCWEEDGADCDGCDGSFVADNLDSTSDYHEHHTYSACAILCPDCLADARLDVLYARLVSALDPQPLFKAPLSPARRVMIRLAWSAVHEVALSAFTSATETTAAE